LTFVALIPVLCVMVFGIMLITMPMYKRVQGSLDQVTADTRQNLSGVRVLRAFTMEQAEQTAFAEHTAQLQKRQQTAGRISNLMNPLTLVAVNLAVVILIRIGAMKVYQGILTQGMVIALYNYMSQILVELVKMANLIISMTKAAACADRVATVLEIPVEQDDGTVIPARLEGRVEFRNVTAQYQGAAEASLENISFVAQPGQTIGIIGGTGSGKTTLINLIPRLYDAAQGQVLIDGEDVRSFDGAALRRLIGIVPQKSVLFQGTIRKNLLWGNPDATEAELWDALEIAQAREVVKSKEEELDAKVEQGGRNFSGGQRQRLAIARALVRKPAILILDDSASALDYATDARLRMAIRGMQNPPTTFIVSQRAASVRYADQILVLDDGVLVGQGTHDRLLESCPVYQEIYYSQFPKEVPQDG
jgi:ABC-type multidrug transport system fused ATPase/permease subunit